MDQDLCLVWLYCVIDGVLRSIGRVRQRGPAPELTDAEVLTIQLWGEIRGLPNDASVWRDAATSLHEWFPNLCNEWNFVRRCGSLDKPHFPTRRKNKALRCLEGVVPLPSD